MASLAQQLPQAHASLRPFLQRAVDFDAKQPVVSYYLRMHVVQNLMAHKDPDSKKFLFTVIDHLEAQKKALPDLASADGRSVVTKTALMLFAKADDAERNGEVSDMIVKCFFTSSILLAATAQFNEGKMDPFAAEKHKYAQVVCGKMQKALSGKSEYVSPNATGGSHAGGGGGRGMDEDAAAPGMTGGPADTLPAPVPQNPQGQVDRMPPPAPAATQPPAPPQQQVGGHQHYDPRFAGGGGFPYQPGQVPPNAYGQPPPQQPQQQQAPQQYQPPAPQQHQPGPGFDGLPDLPPMPQQPPPQQQMPPPQTMQQQTPQQQMGQQQNGGGPVPVSQMPPPAPAAPAPVSQMPAPGSMGMGMGGGGMGGGGGGGGGGPGNPSMQDMERVMDAQKYAKQAVSALQFFDAENAKKQLKRALEALEGVA